MADTMADAALDDVTLADVTQVDVTMADVTMEWLMEDAIDPRAGISLARMSVAVGVTSPPHHHSNCTETIHLVEGEIEQRIDGAWKKMKAGDTCLVPINAVHQTRNIGNIRAVMMIAYSAGARNYNKSFD